MLKVYEVVVSYSTRLAAASPEDAELKIRRYLSGYPDKPRVKVTEVTDFDTLEEGGKPE